MTSDDTWLSWDVEKSNEDQPKWVNMGGPISTAMDPLLAGQPYWQRTVKSPVDSCPKAWSPQLFMVTGVSTENQHGKTSVHFLVYIMHDIIQTYIQTYIHTFLHTCFELHIHNTCICKKNMRQFPKFAR